MADNTDIDWKTFMPDDFAVLCFIQQSGEVLLIEKKRGLGAGKTNGPGGKLETDEDYLHAAIRETEEEVGLTPREPEWHGTLDFAFTDGYKLRVRVYVAENYEGQLIETDEARPFWVETDKIPFNQMWVDDQLWLPVVLSGTEIAGRFIFDGDNMLYSEIQLDTKEFL